MRRFRRCTLPLAATLALAMITPVTPSIALAQEATPAAACPETSPQQNVELVQQWFAALAGESSDEVAALASPDVIYHAPSPDLAQTDDVETWADKRQQDYQDLEVTLEHVFAGGDMVSAYTRYRGTHAGDSEDALGVPATGQTIEWVGMANFRIECGKIADVWSVADDLGRLRRLGVITAEELQSVEQPGTPVP